MAMKKATGPAGEDIASTSAALALPSKGKKLAKDTVVSSLTGVEFEKAELDPPKQIIATSSVPKVSMVERARRKMGAKPKERAARTQAKRIKEAKSKIMEPHKKAKKTTQQEKH